MSGYTKLFNSILDSTIWDQSNATRLLWVTMLAMVNKSGIVEASVPGLASRARLPIDDVKQALDVLTSADPDSRSSEFEGRRIERVNGGWKLLNYQKYREIHADDQRREYMRGYMRKYRTKVNPSKPNGEHDVNPRLAMLAKAEAEAYITSPPTPSSPVKVVNFHDQNQNPKPKPQPQFPKGCMMPDCKGQARAGLPGHASLFCSEVCYEYAKRLDPENIK